MIDELPSALRDALGQVIADQRREWRRERELLEAQSRETISLLRAENAELRETVKNDVAERLASLRDGRDGEPGAPGKDADLAPLLEQFEQAKAGVTDRLDELCSRVDVRLATLKDGEPGKDADLSPVLAEFELIKSGISDHFGELSRRIDARLAEVKDGEPGAPGEPGKDADLSPVLAEFEQVKSVLAEHAGTLGRELIDKVNARLAEVKDGAPGRDGADGVDGKDGAPGAPGAPGKLSVVREWTARVHYEGDCVTHNGSAYQAVRDTGGEPPGQDWALIAAKGADARPLRVRGTFSESVSYDANDFVAVNGSSFVAIKDNPGACPGEGWQLLASAGKRGKEGPPGKGTRGEPGLKGASIIAVSVEGMDLVLVDSDGEQLRADLSPIAEQILAAAR